MMGKRRHTYLCRRFCSYLRTQSQGGFSAKFHKFALTEIKPHRQ